MLSGKRHQDVGKFEALRSFLMILAFVLVSMPGIYGIVLIAFDNIWPLERTALSIPYAPRSWGVVMLLVAAWAGIASLRTQWYRLYSYALRTLCLVWSVLAVTLFIDTLTDVGQQAIIPAVFVTSFAILSAGASVLEDAWRK